LSFRSSSSKLVKPDNEDIGVNPSERTMS
jgi:hypothetical protein